MDATPKTLIEAVRFFSDLDRCNEYMKGIKWPDGAIACPKCGGQRIGEIKTRKMLRCKGCRKQFSYKVGTIFEDSPLGLDKWFVAVWCITSAKNGISSYELSRALGITQKSAWHMLHRIRVALSAGNFSGKLSGTVEADETFVGGKAKNMHKAERARKIKGRGAVGKTIVQGVLQRGGMVIAGVVQDSKRKTLQPNVRASVEAGASIYTDALRSYEGLEDEYLHDTVDHAKEYVRGDVHTNGMENFWSLLKRCLNGTYISVMPWHLCRYVDEQVFRFNERKLSDGERFDVAMAGVVGNRLTYTDLVELNR
ncbi:MAG: IS1595 family transposase [Planctomycetaceae bacterium]|nr:IS1595 family transposase [Planctomycetaceae bacterium]MCB9953108.1 IS1595 family transposase [Planctomycetaceae bacterium]